MTIVRNQNGVEFDIDSIITDLNNKADKDLTNIDLSALAKNIIMDLLMPDYKNGYGVPNGTVDVWYTATKNLIVIAGQANNTYLNIAIKDENGTLIPSGYYGVSGNVIGLTSASCNVLAIVPKGYSYMITSGNANVISIFEYPLKGTN